MMNPDTIWFLYFLMADYVCDGFKYIHPIPARKLLYQNRVETRWLLNKAQQILPERVFQPFYSNTN